MQRGKVPIYDCRHMQENFGASWEKYMRAQEATGKGHATNFQTHLNKMQASMASVVLLVALCVHV